MESISFRMSSTSSIVNVSSKSLIKVQILIWRKENKKRNKGAFNNYVDKKGGRGGQLKVHACPPRGGGGYQDVHVDKKLKENYRRIMANDHEKSYYTSSFRCMQYIKDD